MEAKTLPAAQPRFYSAKTVARLFDVHPSTPWRWANAEDNPFPKPIKLSAGVTRWRAADIDAMFHVEEDAS